MTESAVAGSSVAPSFLTRPIRGWRLAVSAVLLGALATAALPPFYLVVALIPAFAGFVWLTAGIGLKRGFIAGWWFGLGHFATGLYWLAHSLLIEPERFAWMLPFSLLGLPSLLGVFTGAAAAVAARLPAGRPAARVFAFAAAWMIAEWTRGWVLTGFPWNLIGTAWADSPTMIQAAALIGTYGLSLVTVLTLAMPVVLLGRRGDTLAVRSIGPWATTLGAFALLALVGAVAGARTAMQDDPGIVADVRLRLIQPNIPQTLKWDPAMRRRHVAEQLALATGPSTSGSEPTHILWSEAAVPYFLANEPEILRLIGEATPPGGFSFVGAPRGRFGPDRLLEAWNSLHVVDPQGRIVAVYDKAHLTPFGEYVPFRSVLPIDKLTEGRVDFSPGDGVKTLRVPGLPAVGPLICYEAVFPAEVVDRSDRPRWLLNITNDGWFGLSTGPHQHFASARMRAVEEGLPLVRVANTGISAVIDSLGRVVAKLDLGETGVVDAALPGAQAELTPYARHGNRIPIGFALAAGLLGILGAGRRLRR